MEVIERYPSLSDRSDEDKSRGEEQEFDLLVSERGDIIERSATMSYDVIAEQARMSCGGISSSDPEPMMSHDVIAKLVLGKSFEIAVSPSIGRNRANATGASGLVRPSANIELVVMYSIEITPRSTNSLR